MSAKIIDIKDARKRLNNAKQAKMMDDIVAMNIAAWATFWRTMFVSVVVLKKD